MISQTKITKGENDMKAFMTPEIEIKKFCVEDVITTSGDVLPTDPNESERDP